MPIRGSVAATLIWLGCAVAAQAIEATPAAYDKEVLPLLKKYCNDCHSGQDANAGLDLDVFKTAGSTDGHKEVWSRVLRNTQQELMPPLDAEQPTPEERKKISAWIQGYVFKVDCAAPPRPGRVTMRRLNRNEYNNTIRDLLGVDFKPADDFPADEVGYGFDNIGDVLAMPPILLEKYLAASEKIVRAAVMTAEDKKPPVVVLDGAKLTGGGASSGARLLGSKGEVGTEYTFGKRGSYTIRVKAWGDQAGKEPCKMELKGDGHTVRTVDVRALEGAPEYYQYGVETKADDEKHRISVEFTNDYYEPENPDPKQRDRNLYVAAFEISGPKNFRPEIKESHKRIFTAHPSKKVDDRKVARDLITNFTRKAYRRPTQPEEIDRLLKVYDYGRSEGEDFEGAVGLTLQAVLVSPNFIFRVENDPKSLAADGVYQVNEHELATRLSYFLWSSMPDAELFELADKGELRKNLDKQVKRMLADPKSQALVDNFARQWLTLRTLDTFNPDRRRFAEWNDDLRNSMRQETEMFFAYVMREDRPILEFLDCDYTFLNEQLAKHYGLPNVAGSEFRYVKLDGTNSPRGGLLTQASILSVTSNPTRTSPVKRGKWVLEQMLGTPPPPPPPGVPELEDGKRGKLTGSLRQRMEQHRKDPNCASCHTQMDQIGFGLENFNAVGQWRDKDGDFAIDPAGELPGGNKFSGPSELKRVLLRKADFFRRNLVDKLLTYATGRGVEYYDQCSVDAIAETTINNGDKFSQLVLAIVKSAPFQQRRGPAGEN